MGYMEIPNLYRAQDVLAFRRVYALEKVHGTSAHVAWKDGAIRFFSGGAKHEHFVACFDHAALTTAFEALGHPEVVVFGEAYGGKMQGMSATYGPDLRFIAFEVKVGDVWLRVPDAADVCAQLGIEFVPWCEVDATVEALNAERDLPSEVAVRRGTGVHPREGIVIRPLMELRDNRGNRIIAKHKGEAFSERASKADTVVDPAKHALLVKAEAVAQEWVTPARLEHVLDALAIPDIGMESTGKVIHGMIADIRKEATATEIAWDKTTSGAIGASTARLFKRWLMDKLTA